MSIFLLIMKQEKTKHNEHDSDVLPWMFKPFTQYEECRQCLYDGRNTIPHIVDIQDIGTSQSLNEEIYHTGIG